METVTVNLEKIAILETLESYKKRGMTEFVVLNLAKLPEGLLEEHEIRSIMALTFFQAAQNENIISLANSFFQQHSTVKSYSFVAKGFALLLNPNNETFEEQMAEWYPNDFGPNKKF